MYSNFMFIDRLLFNLVIIQKQGNTETQKPRNTETNKETQKHGNTHTQTLTSTI